jgi:hypothetical protein
VPQSFTSDGIFPIDNPVADEIVTIDGDTGKFVKSSGTKVTDLTTFVLYFLAGVISPADATTYYFNHSDVVPNTTATNFRTNIGFAFTITGLIFTSGRNSTAGSTETGTVKIRNITQTSSSTVGSASTEGSTTLAKSFTFTGLNISIGANDDFCVQFDAPTWATNPIATQWSTQIICKKTV